MQQKMYWYKLMSNLYANQAGKVRLNNLYILIFYLNLFILIFSLYLTVRKVGCLLHWCGKLLLFLLPHSQPSNKVDDNPMFASICHASSLGRTKSRPDDKK